MTWITIEILLYSPTSKDKAYEAVYGNCKNKKLVKTSTNILAAKQKEKQLLEEYEKGKKKKKNHGVHTLYSYDSDSDTSERENQQYFIDGWCNDLRTQTLKNSDHCGKIDWSPFPINSNSCSSNSKSKSTTNSDSESFDNINSDSRSSDSESTAE